jgi:AcrR family transcriptional regulator
VLRSIFVRLPAKAGLHDEIIRVSIEIGGESGEDGLTMRAIASRLGMSSTGIYQHFDSKASILREVRFHGVRMLLEVLQAAMHHDDVATRVREMSLAYLRFAGANRWLYGLLFDEPELDWHTMTPEDVARARGPIDAARATFVEGARQGSLRDDVDPQEAALTVWASLHGAASLLLSGRLSSTHPIFPVTDLDRFSEMFVAGLMRSIEPQR